MGRHWEAASDAHTVQWAMNDLTPHDGQRDTRAHGAKLLRWTEHCNLKKEEEREDRAKAQAGLPQ